MERVLRKGPDSHRDALQMIISTFIKISMGLLSTCNYLLEQEYMIQKRTSR